jgi:hypothetical protein
MNVHIVDYRLEAAVAAVDLVMSTPRMRLARVTLPLQLLTGAL